MKKLSSPLLVSLLCLFGGCVNLTTKQPINVDINMRLDVYEHSPAAKILGDKSTQKETLEASVQTRRRNRSGDIQTFKNSQLVGERHDGLLEILKVPDGAYGDYVRKTVQEENADRTQLMKQLANDQKVSLVEIQKKQAQLWRDQAFTGEWIETPDPNRPDKFIWAQKGS